MRVLMIHSETTWRGGENQLALLMRGLRDAGVGVVLAAPRRAAIARAAGELGVPHVPLAIRGGLDLVAAARLARHLRREPYDVLHCHSAHAHSTAFLATWRGRGRAPGRRRPAVVVSRRVDFAVPRCGPAALKYRHADLFVAISRGVRDVLLGCGIDPARIVLVPSGIDLERHRSLRDTAYLRSEFELAPGTTLIGNVAALAPHKSQSDFIRAAKIVAEQMQPVQFLVVGEGPLRQQLVALIRDLGVQETVRLTGFRDDVLEMVSLLDCFVLSSYLEGLGTSIMDAQVLGVPVVATRTGGVPELVEDGVTGLLVPPRRPEELARAILRMLREPGLRERCVQNARARAAAYDYRRMVRGTLAAYSDLLGPAAGQAAGAGGGAQATAAADHEVIEWRKRGGPAGG